MNDPIIRVMQPLRKLSAKPWRLGDPPRGPRLPLGVSSSAAPDSGFSPIPPCDAVLLDMDGTLTVSCLDFPAIKREMGIGTRPILEALAEMAPAERSRAEAILLRHERQAAEASSLAEGCRELLDWLAERGKRFAVITRNSRESLTTVFRLHALPQCVCVTRDDAVHKPDPAPLLLACERLGVEPGRAWMVGDGRFDVEAGLAAGMPTVWLRLGRPQRPFEAQPWRTVEDLAELLRLLRGAT